MTTSTLVFSIGSEKRQPRPTLIQPYGVQSAETAIPVANNNLQPLGSFHHTGPRPPFLLYSVNFIASASIVLRTNGCLHLRRSQSLVRSLLSIMFETVGRGRGISKKPSQYPPLAFHLIRLGQWISSLYVAIVIFFFVHHLHEEHFGVPWTFLLVCPTRHLITQFASQPCQPLTTYRSFSPSPSSP